MRYECTKQLVAASTGFLGQRLPAVQTGNPDEEDDENRHKRSAESVKYIRAQFRGLLGRILVPQALFWRRAIAHGSGLGCEDRCLDTLHLR